MAWNANAAYDAHFGCLGPLPRGSNGCRCLYKGWLRRPMPVNGLQVCDCLLQVKHYSPVTQNKQDDDPSQQPAKYGSSLTYPVH
eukprot:4704883-Amphidinium_carterae.1